MKILLTGATGYLGSHLLLALMQKGHEVIVQKRSTSDILRIASLLSNVQSYDLDRCSVERPFEEHDDIGAVIHTSTCYGRKRETISEVFDANTCMPVKLIEAASQAGVSCFINSDTSLARDLNPYTLSKKQFVEWGKVFAKQCGFSFVNLELEHFYGPGDNESKFTSWVIRSCLRNAPNLPLTKGEQRRDFIYIEDVVRAFECVLQKSIQPAPKQQAFVQYQVGSGTAVSMRDFVQTVIAICNSNTRPDFGAVPYRENEVMDSVADITDLYALGWEPQVGLVEGLRKVIEGERG